MNEAMTAPAVNENEMRIDGWYLALGILLVFGGVYAVLAPVSTTFITLIFIGWFLIFSGMMQIIGAVVNRKAENMWLGIFVGALAFVAGLMIVTKVLASLVAVTMLIGIFFLVDGVSRSILAIAKRPVHWGLMLTSGLISIFLSILILAKIVASSALLLGTLMGVYMFFAGMEMIVVYYASKK